MISGLEYRSSLRVVNHWQPGSLFQSFGNVQAVHHELDAASPIRDAAIQGL